MNLWWYDNWIMQDIDNDFIDPLKVYEQKDKSIQPFTIIIVICIPGNNMNKWISTITQVVYISASSI